MLSASSFSSPYEHLSQAETKRMVEHYTAYLSDNTRLIANPGLKVRRQVPTPSLRPEKVPESLHLAPLVLLAGRAHSSPRGGLEF